MNGKNMLSCAADDYFAASPVNSQGASCGSSPKSKVKLGSKSFIFSGTEATTRQGVRMRGVYPALGVRRNGTPAITGASSKQVSGKERPERM